MHQPALNKTKSPRAMIHGLYLQYLLWSHVCIRTDVMVVFLAVNKSFTAGPQLPLCGFYLRRNAREKTAHKPDYLCQSYKQLATKKASILILNENVWKNIIKIKFNKKITSNIISIIIIFFCRGARLAPPPHHQLRAAPSPAPR